MRRVLLRCICGNTLAAEIAGLTVVRHRGREWAGFVVSIRCERCGRIWRPGEDQRLDAKADEEAASLA